MPKGSLYTLAISGTRAWLSPRGVWRTRGISVHYQVKGCPEGVKAATSWSPEGQTPGEHRGSQEASGGELSGIYRTRYYPPAPSPLPPCLSDPLPCRGAPGALKELSGPVFFGTNCCFISRKLCSSLMPPACQTSQTRGMSSSVALKRLLEAGLTVRATESSLPKNQ